MIDAKSMESEVATDILHVAVVGPENNGKSILCSTAPGGEVISGLRSEKASSLRS